VIKRYLHTQCVADNNSKRDQIKVAIEVDEDGTIVYDLHPPSYIADAAELFDRLTGRDRTLPKVMDPVTNEMVSLAPPLARTMIMCSHMQVHSLFGLSHLPSRSIVRRITRL
jgi:gamma-glutamylcysteine synthetase